MWGSRSITISRQKALALEAGMAPGKDTGKKLRRRDKTRV